MKTKQTVPRPSERRPVVQRETDPATEQVEITASPHEAPAPVRPAVQVTLADPSDAILLPMETENPNVTILDLSHDQPGAVPEWIGSRLILFPPDQGDKK